MPDIPRDSGIESSLSLLGEGYSFIPSRCQRLGSKIFQIRLLMQNTICMSGEEAATLFYDEQLFQRQHAAPRMLQKTLFGEGGVQGLDDEAHRHRKQFFMSLLTDDAVAELVRLSEANWQAAIETWQRCDRVVLARGAGATHPLGLRMGRRAPHRRRTDPASGCAGHHD